MTILTRIILRADWPDELRRMFPRITAAQIDRFHALAMADKLVDDDGEPAEALMAWCEGVR